MFIDSPEATSAAVVAAVVGGVQSQPEPDTRGNGRISLSQVADIPGAVIDTDVVGVTRVDGGSNAGAKADSVVVVVVVVGGSQVR